jgi:hypothetical protein
MAIMPRDGPDVLGMMWDPKYQRQFRIVANAVQLFSSSLSIICHEF